MTPDDTPNDETELRHLDPETNDDQEPTLVVPPFKDLTLRQLFWLQELDEHGQPAEISRHYREATPSKLSRDLSAVSKALNIDDLYSVTQGQVHLSEETQHLLEVLRPAFAVLKRYSEGGIHHEVHVGSGGSLAAWLIGRRSSAIREMCSKWSDKSDIQLSCQPLRNREILNLILTRVLDFGLIRTSLLDSLRPSVRSMISEVHLGNMRYGLQIPHEILMKYHPKKSWNDQLPPEIEKQILAEEPIATVWPEGEFKMRLEWALRDLPKPRIEFAYRSFPQALPHLLAGTHVGIMPHLPDFKVDIPNCSSYLMNLLENYHRSISLICNTNPIHKWIDIQSMADLLKFGPTIDN